MKPFAFSHQTVLKQPRKHPLKTTRAQTAGEPLPPRRVQRRRRFLQCPRCLRRGCHPSPPYSLWVAFHQRGSPQLCPRKFEAKPSLCQFLASHPGLSLISPSHPHAYLSRNILMQHYPILTLDTCIQPRRCFRWSFGHFTWFGNGVNLHQQLMKPGCEHGGFAAVLPALRMDRRTDRLTDGDP